jgi:DNA-binding transcriptional MerR regulator
MKHRKPTVQKTSEEYGVAALALQTGLSIPVIRMWERRYQALAPRRTATNRRLYSAEDLARLLLLAKLTRHGHAISTIAQLSLIELKQRSEAVEALLPPRLRSGDGEHQRLFLVGTGLDELRSDQRMLEGQVVANFTGLAEAKAASKLPQADLLVVQTENLFGETVALLRGVVKRSKVRRTILIYHFASSVTTVALARGIGGLCLLRAPVSASQLWRECVVGLNSLSPQALPVPPGGSDPIPERLYQNEQLERMSHISTALKCECPSHLAEIVQSFGAFERYCQHCEDRNPEDARLHDFLHRTTAHVRRLMEEALRHVTRFEGLEC